MFGHQWNESVRELQLRLGRPTWEDLVEKRTTKFLSKLHDSNMFIVLISKNLHCTSFVLYVNKRYTPRITKKAALLLVDFDNFTSL